MELMKIEATIEAILFTMGESVELKKIAVAIGHDEETTRKIIHNMMDKYKTEDRGIQIIELEDSFQTVSYTHLPKYDAMTDFELVDELEKISGVPVPQAIEDIRSAPVLHRDVCDADQMQNTVKNFLGIK